MNDAAIKKTEIVRALALIPDSKLDRVHLYIETILRESHLPEKSSQSLKGIWSDKGFEKILDLENELKEVRKELTESISKSQI